MLMQSMSNKSRLPEWHDFAHGTTGRRE